MPPADARRERAARPGAARLPVLLPLPFDGPLDYRREADSPAPGSFVEVPLGNRRVAGVVWDGEGDGAVGDNRLRPVTATLDIPPLPGNLRRFAERLAAYTLQPLGTALRLFIIAANRDEPRLKVRYRPTGVEPPRLTAGRAAALAAAGDGKPRTVDVLAREAGVSAGVVRGLIDLGVLGPVAIDIDAPPQPDPDHARPCLSPGQAAAAAALVEDVEKGGFQATLLDGVTGSGKTEVYCEAIARALRNGGQVLVLLPEIALTAGLVDRFAARFGTAPALWHSDLGAVRRRRVWRDVAEGRLRFVVGARSALFLPFGALRLVVVDEEHDPAFKQDDGIAYHGRDMAVLRAKIEDCPVILASATPSLETIANVEAGRYGHLTLPDRHGGAQLPQVTVLDLRQDALPRGRFLSPRLVRAMAETLAKGEQSLLFLNRRGYAPLTLCRHCGTRIDCPNCTAWLVEHRLSRRLVCHHCGYGIPLPEVCPECGAADTLAACGPGVERIEEEVAEVLPQARRLVMASDTLNGPAALQAALDAVAARAVDVVIGTQVVAKGHHFPHLTLVGVVDADLGLDGGDLRAAERTFQMLTQVAGRAGRAERPGRALLQSWNPDSDVLRAIARGDRAGFMAIEAAARRRHDLPPYGRLVALIVSGDDQGAVMTAARMLARTAPAADGLTVLGPAPAPLSMLRGRHRVRLLVRAGRDVPVQAILRPWLRELSLPGSVRLQVDVDPYSFL